MLRISKSKSFTKPLYYVDRQKTFTVPFIGWEFKWWDTLYIGSSPRDAAEYVAYRQRITNEELVIDL